MNRELVGVPRTTSAAVMPGAAAVARRRCRAWCGRKSIGGRKPGWGRSSRGLWSCAQEIRSVQITRSPCSRSRAEESSTLTSDTAPEAARLKTIRRPAHPEDVHRLRQVRPSVLPTDGKVLHRLPYTDGCRGLSGDRRERSLLADYMKTTRFQPRGRIRPDPRPLQYVNAHHRGQPVRGVSACRDS